jgi:PiT family inorganic phosphate transporter
MNIFTTFPVYAIFLIIIALVFEFINGFHDTANAVATSISTKSLEPFQAISISAIFNLFGALSGTAVAVTIAKGFANPDLATPHVILAALLAAITWNLATWYIGLPSSSSHALIGGLVGAIGFSTGFHNIFYWNLGKKVLIPMVISPMLGFTVALIIFLIFHRLFKNNTEPRRTNNFIREIQVLSTAFLSFSHGANDAQKTMGIITLILFNFGMILTPEVPTWVIIICAVFLALGTFSGGIRIIKTLSTRVAQLKPVSGFAAEISSALVLFAGARLGIPLSTTHAVTGSIMGSGVAENKNINLVIVRSMIVAWIVTVPMCMILAGIFFKIIFFLAKI